VRAVVVGGGLAGAAAALELRERGSEAVLVRAGPGATAMSWGTLDVAAASPLRRGGLSLRDPTTGRLLPPARRLLALANGSAAHPYATLLRGRSPDAEVKEAAAALDGWLAPSGLRVIGSLEQTRWLADVRGAVRAADLAFSGAGEGDLASAEEIALVDMRGLAGFDARPALRALAAELTALGLSRRPLRLLRLDLPPALAELAAVPARLASALETAPAREALRSGLERLAGEGRLLLFPPGLGLERVDRVLAWLADTTGCRCAELLGALPLPLAGYRLDRALGAALGREGVETRTGRAVSIEAEGGRAARVRVAAAGAPDATLALDTLVLATGRFVGGGVVERAGRLAEGLLDLPLYDLAGRRVDGVAPRRLTRRDYEGEQPLFAAGVRIDARLRPLGADGAVRLPNVFAAGDLLGSFDPARERTGLGVALLSGRRAGIEAAKC
jgi:glycerol-3-phosphate dehydrogenase subunit B